MSPSGVRELLKVGDLIKLTWRDAYSKRKRRLIGRVATVGDSLWISPVSGKQDRFFGWETLESGEVTMTLIARNVSEFHGWIDRDEHIRDADGNVIGMLK